MRLLVLILFSFPAFGQTIVSDVADLRKIPIVPWAQAQGYYKPFDGNGGIFRYNATEKPDNGGTVIRSDFGGVWEREVQSGNLDIGWFGAKPDTNTDNRQAVIKTINAAQKMLFLNNPNYYSSGNVYANRGVYRMSDSVEIWGTINIIGLGAGTGKFNETQFWFDAGRGGFYFKANSSFGGGFSRMENISITGRGTQGKLTKHGIHSEVRLTLRNCYVFNMPGDGIRFDTRVAGHASLSVVDHCEVYYNQGYGISFFGYDSNQCSVYDINAHTNGLSNIHDESTHGNNYFSGHLSYAGIRQNNVRGFTKHLGKIYYGWNKSKGIEPGVASNWQEYWVHSPIMIFDSTQYNKWNADSTYYDALPIWCNTPIAKNNFWGTYCEGGQGAVALGQYSIWWNPTDGADVVKPWMAKFGITQGRLEQISGTGIYKRDYINTRTYSALTYHEGKVSGSDKPGAGRVAEWYNENDTADWHFANGLKIPSWWMPGRNLTNHPEYGREKVQGAVIVNGMYGQFFSDITDIGEGNHKLSKKRMFAMGSKAPTATTIEYGAGDFVLNLGTDTTIFGWKCISRGKPGTWVAIKTGN